MKVRFIRLHPDAPIPVAATPGSAGVDLHCLCDRPITILPGQTELLHTGLAMEIPEGYVGLVFARSGIANKRGLAPSNKVGVVDSDYRGELRVSLHNHSNEPQTVEPLERVAQLCVVPYVLPEFVECETLSDTERGCGGYGSTGKN